MIPISLHHRDQTENLRLIFGFLALLVVLAYINSLQNDFVFDDKPLIQENPLIKDLGNIPNLFLTDYWAGRRTAGDEGTFESLPLYRPLVTTTFALNYALGGLNPFGYHLFNVLLHLGVTWLLYGLARTLAFSPLASGVAASIFAVHPLHTEAVTAVVGRTELLMAAGLLATLWLARKGRLWLSTMAFAVALLSKEQAIVIPLLLIFMDLCTRGGDLKGRAWRPTLLSSVRRSLPYVIVLGGYLILRSVALEDAPATLVAFFDNPLYHVGWETRILTALKIAGYYLWLFFWPASLSPDYSYNSIPLVEEWWDPAAIAGMLAWGGLLALGIQAFIRRSYQRACAVGFTLFTFLPASNLILPIGTIMGERLFYLPSAGLCLLGGLLGQHLAQRLAHGLSSDTNPGAAERSRMGKPLWHGVQIVFCLILAGLIARTIDRNADWASSLSLFGEAVQRVPESMKVQAIWGELLFEEGKPDQALQALERSIGIYPNWYLPHYNRGVILVRQGQYQKAEHSYRAAMRLAPGFPNVYTALSRLYLIQNRPHAAETMAREAIRINGRSPAAHYFRAVALEDLGQLKDALAEYETVVDLDPSNDAIRQHVVRLRRKLGP